MGSRTYLVSIYSDNTIEDRVYTINHRSAMRAAEKYGKAEPNETITVRTHSGQLVKKQKYATRRGAMIAMGKCSDGWRFVSMTGKGKLSVRI